MLNNLIFSPNKIDTGIPVEFNFSISKLINQSFSTLRSKQEEVEEVKYLIEISYPSYGIFDLHLIAHAGSIIDGTHGLFLVVDIAVKTMVGLKLHELDNIHLKFLELNSSKELTKFITLNLQKDITVTLTFHYIHLFPFDSTITFCLTHPKCTPLFQFLNNKRFSDCSFEVGEEKLLLWVNKYFLTKESLFFKKMFEEEWSESIHASMDKVILLKDWSVEACIGCLLHIYTGWLPWYEMPISVPRLFDLDSKRFTLSMNYLTDLTDLAKMLQLNVLAFSSSLFLKEKLLYQISSLSLKPKLQPKDSVPLQQKHHAVSAQGLEYSCNSAWI